MNQNNKWSATIRQSIKSNQQLEFINQVTISYVHNSLPYIQSLRYRDIINDSIIFFADRRSKFVQQLSTEVQLLWYFPLSREKYIIRCRVQEIPGEEYWQKVDKEERKAFHSIEPDKVLDLVGEHLKTDLDKFNTPDKDQLSPNFVVLSFEAYKVEHVKEVMPQVIADARTTFESVFKPYKKEQKTLHTKTNEQWLAQPLS